MKQNKLALLLLSSTLIFSCAKDEPQLSTPQIKATGTSDTLLMGHSIALHPHVTYEQGLTYAWRVNNVTKSTDSAFNFNPSDRGDYRVVFFATNSVGTDSLVFNIKVNGKYENGFLVLQEGQYGVANGDFAYYSYDSSKVTMNIYKKENPTLQLGPTDATLQYATIFNGDLYMVVKVGGPLVVVDAYTFKEKARIPKLPADIGHAFLGISANKGLLSSADGLYQVQLNPLTLGTKIPAFSGAAGDMLLVGDKIYVMSETEGIVILSATDYSVLKKIPKATLGFAKTKDAIWAAGDSSLFRISPNSMDVARVPLSFGITNPWALWSWRSASITANPNGNEVYIAQRKEAPGIGGTLEYSGNKIFRYKDGDLSSLSTPFITLPPGQYFYGSAVRYNERKQQLLVYTLADEWGSSNDNKWQFYDAHAGTLLSTVQYTGYYFPALSIYY
ncbi:uncharacterized protein DUF5074 [Chitinophaga skermanii]|uniref:Uncharacterized protein DUF5074 n=1 Tax=Chitinophaga skermanii TaxID=331697 RepID=A0A327QM84_9BACT|nr:DUF5074 domain-containing protein [Chitinophaga skermanii]RAJ05371.1 uncharacterized protein DUF5074 [Chitinophaga skermanii]